MTEPRVINTHGMFDKPTSRRSVQVIQEERPTHNQAIVGAQDFRQEDIQSMVTTDLEDELQRRSEARHELSTRPPTLFAHSQSKVIANQAYKSPAPVFSNVGINPCGNLRRAQSTQDAKNQGREELETRDVAYESGATTTVQQCAEVPAGSEHRDGRTIVKLPSKWSRKLTHIIEAAPEQPLSDSWPRNANTDDERLALKIVNGLLSGKESTKRKAPEGDRLTRGRDSVQPQSKKTKMAVQPVLKAPRLGGDLKVWHRKKSVTVSRAQQASAPSENYSQDSDSDGMSVMFGEMPDEEESQWKHELYDLKVARAMKIMPRAPQDVLENSEPIASVISTSVRWWPCYHDILPKGAWRMFHMEYIPLIRRSAGTLDNPWNIASMLQPMQHSWDALMKAYPDLERTFDEEIYKLSIERLYEWHTHIASAATHAIKELWASDKKYNKAEARENYVARTLSKGFPLIFGGVTRVGTDTWETKNAFGISLVLKTLAAHLEDIAPVDTEVYYDLVDRCGPRGALVLALTAVERALIRWQSGEEDKTQGEFSEQCWGVKSLQYAKSARYLSNAKLDEIFLAARRYLEVKARMAFTLTSGTSEDKIRVSSPAHDLDENGPNTVTGEDRNAGDSGSDSVVNNDGGAEDGRMHDFGDLRKGANDDEMDDPDDLDDEGVEDDMTDDSDELMKGAADDADGTSDLDDANEPYHYELDEQ